MMTEAVQVALLVAAPPFLVALTNLIHSVRADRRSVLKLNHITLLTNSTLTAANKRIEELEDIVSKLVEEKTKHGGKS